MARIFEWPYEHRGIVNGRFQLVSTNLTSTAIFSGEVSPYGPVVQRFYVDLTLPQKRGPDHRFLQGIITRLRGQGNRIRIPDYFRLRTGFDETIFQAQKKSNTLQAWSDTKLWTDGTGWSDGYLPPFVTTDIAAVQGDVSLVLRGLPVSTAQVLRVGDLIEHRPNGIPSTAGRLYEVIDDCRTNTNGKTRVYIEPALRAAVAAGDMIVLKYPSTVFRLIDDKQGTMNRIAPGNLGGMGASFMEVLVEAP